MFPGQGLITGAERWQRFRLLPMNLHITRWGTFINRCNDRRQRELQALSSQRQLDRLRWRATIV